MLRSMTGFGRCVMEDADWTQTWEIRSVNNRHLDLKWRLPLQARGLESRLERVVRRFAARGRMEITLTLQQRGAAANLRFDAAQASAMLDQVAALADLHGDTFEPDYNALFAIPTLWERESEDGDDEMEERLEEGLIAALEDWNESRETEGAALARDMTSRIAQMEEWVSRIDERAPEIKEERFAVLRERLSEALAAVNGELEEGRFLQEMVVLSDKLDVSEELTRLHAHLERLLRREGTVKYRSEGCQDLVRFFALLRIKPHAPPLVRVPVNSFEFHSCERTPQVECLMRLRRHRRALLPNT